MFRNYFENIDPIPRRIAAMIRSNSKNSADIERIAARVNPKDAILSVSIKNARG